jgi:cation:H+ antiporter
MTKTAISGSKGLYSSLMLGNLAEVLIGLTLLIWGADRFVHGAAAIARNLGVAPLMIGLTIVSFATSAPEILVSIMAALREEPDLAVGNAIGSNIANIGLVLGATALIRPIELKSATLRREMPALLAVSLLTVALFLDSTLNRIDGFVLLTGLVIVIIWLVRLGLRSSASDPLQADFEAEIPKDMKMGVAVFWLLIGLTALLFGADLLVDGAIEIALTVGVSEVVIGVTLVALATSLPELAVSAVSALRGEYGLAIGNIVGSNIFNLLAVVGVAAAIEPAILPPSVLSLHIFVMVAFTLVLFAMTYEYDGRGAISRFEGFMLISAYIAFTTYVVLQNVRIGD